LEEIHKAEAKPDDEVSIVHLSLPKEYVTTIKFTHHCSVPSRVAWVLKQSTENPADGIFRQIKIMADISHAYKQKMCLIYLV
jgi:Mg2+ and Co2+ transporter CorA